MSKQYETIYGNICEYQDGDTQAYDYDSARFIPLEMVDFSNEIKEEI